jgi:23S rRNA (cytosine1962-C5)-methyltransferase
MKIWRLKKGSDQRFRQGHPWVFSGELGHSTKEVLAGEIVSLNDVTDRFLAFGIAHPSSNISFRKLSTRPKESDLLTTDFFLRRLQTAAVLRQQAGYGSVSHRLCFSEADGLPGLVVDRFRGPDHDLFVFQISTAGIERAKTALLEALKKIAKADDVIVETSTSSHRKLEGLDRSERKVHSGDLKDFLLLLKHGQSRIEMKADFAGGQKTGFFLDQQWNSNLLLELLHNRWKPDQKIRVLDLCCYVGQWSAQIAKQAHDCGANLEVTLVDVSDEALQLAKENVERFGARVVVLNRDVLEDWGPEAEEKSFDVVICDPPAFVKKKPDLAKGLSAYVRLNREAMKRVVPGGLLVTCSCSGGVRETDFIECLNAAKSKAGRTVKWLAHGGHGPDHPVLLEFPEGQYLKCWIGQVDFPF